MAERGIDERLDLRQSDRREAGRKAWERARGRNEIWEGI